MWWFHFNPVLDIIIIAAYCVNAVFAVIVISQNRSPSKTLGYILLFVTLPAFGILIYFVFGENLRKNKLYNRKYLRDQASFTKYVSKLVKTSEALIRKKIHELKTSEPIARMLLTDSRLPLTQKNRVSLLINGEETFASLMEWLEKARHHIHMEYYIIEDGRVAEKMKQLLLRKVKEGVCVRIIYDDYGTTLKRRYRKDLLRGGVLIVPFYKILFPVFSNRHNYRDHRKMVIIDGQCGFLGGINISDRYNNRMRRRNVTYWRDTHLQICGESIRTLQYLFFLNWSFCAGEDIEVNADYFPDEGFSGDQLVQIVASGPDSDRASIMLSYFAAINAAREYVYITTPYFIPNESILDSLKAAALRGVDVRLIVPGISDSRFVNLAAHSYYQDLLETGVRIFFYQKGFIHAKTLVSDHCLSMVGSANMDIRSFDLNFELNAAVYDGRVHDELHKHFLTDMEDSREIKLAAWKKRGRWTRFTESICRLFSSVM